MKHHTMLALLVACASTFGGCVQMNASDNLSVVQSVNLPIPSSFGTQAASTVVLPAITKHIDVSDTVSKLNNIGTVSFAPTGSQVSNQQLDVVSHVHVDMAMSDGTSVALTDTDISTGATSVSLPVLVDGATLQKYLGANGGTDLMFEFTLNPANVPTTLQGTTLSLDYNLSIAATVEVQKSL